MHPRSGVGWRALGEIKPMPDAGPNLWILPRALRPGTWTIPGSRYSGLTTSGAFAWRAM